MSTIVTRAGKGSPLTHAEVDSNFTNLNSDKVEASAGTLTNPTINGTVSTSGLNFDSNTFVIDATNNRVGVGTASPSQILDVYQNSAAILKIRGGSSTNQGAGYYVWKSNNSGSLCAFGDYSNQLGGTPDTTASIYTATSVPLVFAVSNLERMRLDSSGNLGLGVTPSAWGTGNAIKALQLTGQAALYSIDSGTGYTILGNNVYINSGGADTYIKTGELASVYSQVQGNHRWYTAPSGTAGNTITFTQAMTLDAGGNLLVGTTSSGNHRLYKDNAASIALQVYNSSTNTSSSAVELNTNYTGNTTGWFVRGGDNANYRFYIYTNGNMANSNNSYGAISDAKLKENIVDATPKLEKLCQVKVRNYNLIGDSVKQIGVVAQELEQVFPSMVEESPDRDKEGNVLETTTKQVKYSVFVPMLIKALQEQQAIINDLKARIESLENK